MDIKDAPAVESNEEQPKKYIRTFAGDMEILKKGGVPDLTPFVAKPPMTPESISQIEPKKLDLTKPEPEIEPKPSSQPIPPSTVYEPPQEIPIPPPSPVKIDRPVPQPEPSVIREPEPTPVERPAGELKTYANDFQDKVKETNASTASILAVQQDEGRPMPAPQKEPANIANLIYVVVGIVLLVAGGAGAYFAFARYTSIHAPVVLAPTVTAPIFVDERDLITGNGDALSQAIETSIGKTLAPGLVRLLYLPNATSSDTVLSALNVSAPGLLLRNVDPDRSMAGIVNTNGDQTAFFLLTVTSYSSTFAGMLAWEKTMPIDLSALYPAFPPIVSQAVVATTTPVVATSTKNKKTATTTVAQTASTSIAIAAPTSIAGFYDESISNHDVRVYRDEAKRAVLVYGYWNQTTLIIARNAAAFAAIVQRLATSHTN